MAKYVLHNHPPPDLLSTELHRFSSHDLIRMSGHFTISPSWTPNDPILQRSALLETHFALVGFVAGWHAKDRGRGVNCDTFIFFFFLVSNG